MKLRICKFHSNSPQLKVAPMTHILTSGLRTAGNLSETTDLSVSLKFPAVKSGSHIKSGSRVALLTSDSQTAGNLSETTDISISLKFPAVESGSHDPYINEWLLHCGEFE